MCFCLFVRFCLFSFVLFVEFFSILNTTTQNKTRLSQLALSMSRVDTVSSAVFHAM